MLICILYVMSISVIIFICKKFWDTPSHRSTIGFPFVIPVCWSVHIVSPTSLLALVIYCSPLHTDYYQYIHPDSLFTKTFKGCVVVCLASQASRASRARATCCFFHCRFADTTTNILTKLTGMIAQRRVTVPNSIRTANPIESC